MATARCSVIAGPAVVVTAAATYVTQGDITVNVTKNWRDRTTSLNGKIDAALQSTRIEIRFTPVSIPAYAASLIAKQPSDIGDSIFGCTDAYLRIWGRDGKRRDFLAAGVISPPSINLTSRGNLYGEVTFLATVGNNLAIGSAGNVTTESSVSFVEQFDAADGANWVERAAEAAFGSAGPYDDITTDVGITVQVAYETRDRESDLDGLYDVILTGVTANATVTPNNLTSAQLNGLIAMDGADAVPGVSQSSIGEELVLVHTPAVGGLQITFAKAVPTSGGQAWSSENDRWTPVQFDAVLTAEVGPPATLNPLYAIEIVAE